MPLSQGLPRIPGLSVHPVAEVRPQALPRLQPPPLDSSRFYARGSNSFLSQPQYTHNNGHYSPHNGGYYDHMGYRQPQPPRQKIRDPKAIIFSGKRIFLRAFSALPPDTLKLVKQKTKEPKPLSGLDGLDTTGYMAGYGQIQDVSGYHHQGLEQNIRLPKQGIQLH